MDEVRLNVRLPKDLHAKLAKLAEQQVRSLNQQIVYLLTRAMEEVTRKPKQ